MFIVHVLKKYVKVKSDRRSKFSNSHHFTAREDMNSIN